MALTKSLDALGIDSLDIEFESAADRLRDMARRSPAISRESIIWDILPSGDLRVTLTLVNEDEEPTPPGRLIIEAAPFGAFIPNVPMTRIAVGGLDPGERRDVETILPMNRLRALAGSPLIDPANLSAALDAFVEQSVHTHWIGNLNVYFDRRPDQSVERHCAFGLRVPAGSAVGAMFIAFDACDYSTGASEEGWSPEIIAASGSVALLRVKTPSEAGRKARITAYAKRLLDAKTVPIEFEFETVQGWGDTLGCVKLRG